MIDLTDIGSLIIRLIEALAIAFLIPWLKEKFDAEKLQRAGKLVRFAVHAAEQLYGGGHGAEKKEYVTAFLEARNLKLDLDTIDRMIEATVLEMSAALEGEEKPPDASEHASYVSEPAGADAAADSEKILRGSSFSESNPLTLGFDSGENGETPDAVKAIYTDEQGSGLLEETE